MPTPLTSRARLSRIGLGTVLVAGLLVNGPTPAARADVPPPGNVVASIDSVLDDQGHSTHVSTRRGALSYQARSLTDGIEVVWGGPQGVDHRVAIRASDEWPLRIGTYPDVDEFASAAGPGLDVAQEHGEVDVLDLAADADGTVTRFDIVFLSSTTTPTWSLLGEIRMNEPEPTSTRLSPSATALHWPRQEVGGAHLRAVEELTNVSGTPLRLGTARISHGATRDYRLGSDHCSGRTLPRGASCTLAVAFSPRSGGPRNAVLVVPVPGRNLAVSLAGAGRLGSSSLVATDHEGRTETFHHLWADGNGARAASYLFGSEGRGRDPEWGFLVDLADHAGPLTLGHHRTSGDDPTPYRFDLRLGPTCNHLSGTEDVHGFAEDATHQPTYLDLTFSQHCADRGVRHPDVHGRLRWQVRADVRAPVRPTALRRVGAVARWVRSTSHDQAGTIVRVVPGSGRGATPASGLAVGSGGATSGALPRLVRGAHYSLVAFAVDETGNVSSARVVHLTG